MPGAQAVPAAAAEMAFFEGFTLETREANGQRIRLRRAGSGPPLLLLHGNPQTHAMWHRVAPILARDFTVIAPDLRGYGFSSKPPVSAITRPMPSAQWPPIWWR